VNTPRAVSLWGASVLLKKYSINYAVNFVVVSLGESLSSLLVSTGYR